MGMTADERVGYGTALAAVVVGLAGIVFAILPGLFWVAWAAGGGAIGLGSFAHVQRSKAGQAGGVAVAGWILGVVAFVLGWVSLFAPDLF